MPHRYPAPNPRALAADAVYRYLETRQGRGVPLAVKARLLVLDWVALGMAEVPSPAQVHWTRMWMEETDLLDAREHLETVRRALQRSATLNAGERPHEGL
jgi:hypothetical protein